MLLFGKRMRSAKHNEDENKEWGWEFEGGPNECFSELYVQQSLQRQRDRIFTKIQLKTSEKSLSELFVLR